MEAFRGGVLYEIPSNLPEFQNLFAHFEPVRFDPI